MSNVCMIIMIGEYSVKEKNLRMQLIKTFFLRSSLTAWHRLTLYVMILSLAAEWPVFLWSVGGALLV